MGSRGGGIGVHQEASGSAVHLTRAHASGNVSAALQSTSSETDPWYHGLVSIISQQSILQRLDHSRQNVCRQYLGKYRILY